MYWDICWTHFNVVLVDMLLWKKAYCWTLVTEICASSWIGFSIDVMAWNSWFLDFPFWILYFRFFRDVIRDSINDVIRVGVSDVLCFGCVQ